MESLQGSLTEIGRDYFFGFSVLGEVVGDYH